MVKWDDLREKLNITNDVFKVIKWYVILLGLLNITGLFFNFFGFTFTLTLIIILAYLIWAESTRLDRVEKDLKNNNVKLRELETMIQKFKIGKKGSQMANVILKLIGALILAYIVFVYVLPALR